MPSSLTQSLTSNTHCLPVVMGNTRTLSQYHLSPNIPPDLCDNLIRDGAEVLSAGQHERVRGAGLEGPFRL